MAMIASELPETDALISQSEKIATLLEGATCTFQKFDLEKSAQVDEFRSKLQALRLKNESWKTQLYNSSKLAGFCKHSLDVGPIALTALKALEAEEPRLRKLNQPWRSCIKVRYTRRNLDIPVLQLTVALQKVLDAFDNIPKAIRGSRKTSTGSLDGQFKIFRSRLPFGVDKRYIPLRRTVTRIRRALEVHNGPQVVVLHGGPGTGKSSLARYLALHYQDEMGEFDEEKCDSQQFSGSTITRQMSCKTDGSLNVSSRFPGGVFYIPCIQGTSIVEQQLQLLQDLGFTPPIGKLSHLTPDEVHTRLQKKLMEYFGNKDALVVIDNVRDPHSMKWLLIRDSKVKYLVTTQDSKLCKDDGGCLSIQIEQVGLGSARKILASHSAIFDGPESQEVLEALINLTMANPSALTNASMTILRSNDLEEWKDLRNSLETFQSLSLHQQDDDTLDFDPVSNLPFLPEIPRVIGCSMMLVLESLPLGVENLLVALALLEGHIPQVVIQLLVKSTQGNFGSFSRCRNYLEDRGLIRLHSQTAWWSSTVLQTTWYIDSLLQRFIQVTKAKVVRSILDILFTRAGCTESADSFESDHTLTVALCAIYGSPMVAEEAAVYFDAPPQASHMQARIWAAPLVSLLQATEARTEEEKRKQEIHSQARQVLLAYVFNENLDNGGMRELLASPLASQPTCWAIAWAVPNQKRALLARSSDTLQGLLNLLGTFGPDLQECATAALWNLSMAAETKWVVANAPGLLDEVVRLLDPRKEDNIQRHAAGIVASLASEKENQLHLAAFPGLVQGLVRLLKDYVSSSNVQVYAAHALMHLASARPNKEPLAKFPGVLERLVELMDGGVSVHEIAAGTLLNLSTSPDNKPVIACVPRALDNLVRLLAESPSVLAQKRAATAVVNITSHKFLTIRLFPSVLEKLVGLLSKVGRPELQEIAAKILGNLAVVEENAVAIVSFPGAWSELLTLLREQMILEVQMQALDTISLLGLVVPVSQVATAIGDLFDLLAEKVNPGILEKILKAILRILETGNGKNFIAISKCPSSLDLIVQLLGQFAFPSVQENAALVLAALGTWKPNRLPIVQFPGILKALVKLLAEDVKPSLQVATLKTLWHVAHREHLNRKTIAEWPGSLHSIVALLDTEVEPGVQVGAALVLSTLTGVEGKYVKPDEIPSVLEKLEVLLQASDKVNPSVQQEAAKTRTLLDWGSSNLLTFTCSDAYAGRGRANAQLGMLRQALADFDEAIQSMWDKDFSLQRDRLDHESRTLLQNNASPTPLDVELELEVLHGKIAHVLSNRAYVKAVLKDYQGALRDADSALELQPRDNLLWQERGVLKRLTGDLPGAVADLETSLQIAPNDYESLKHCGFAYFLTEDLEAAYAIAQRAMEIDLDQGYDPPDGDEYCRLGKLPVAFLDFTLS